MKSGSTCILTDSSAQFFIPGFKDLAMIKVIPFKVSLGNRIYQENEIDLNTLPLLAGDDLHPQLIPPTPDEFRQTFSTIGQTFEEIIGVFMSSKLSSCYANALEAVSMGERVKIQIIDSRTISTGLGMIVQMMADAFLKGTPTNQLERIARILIPHIYTLFCVPGLSYLSSNHLLDKTQALVGEMLNLYPTFAMEDGNFIPLGKTRNQRHASVLFQEFLDEFEHLQHIALLKGVATRHTPEFHWLENYKSNQFPAAIFTEQSLSLPLSILLGPHTTGLIVVETTD